MLHPTRLRAAATAALLAAILVGCATKPAPSIVHTEQGFAYFTHCGLAQTSWGLTTYYPTALYHGDEVVAAATVVPGPPESQPGPLAWVGPDGGHPPESGINLTYGTFKVYSDGTAVFSLATVDYWVAFTDDPRLPHWVQHGCY